MWPDARYLDLTGIRIPIVQSPMAGANLSSMAIAATTAGGLGSLPCAMLSAEAARNEMNLIRQRTDGPFNANFFCHTPVDPDAARERGWRDRLRPYYEELGIDPAETPSGGGRMPFDQAMCDLVVEMRPRVVSFHFGLPEPALLDQVKAAGCIVQSSATTVAEARWLEDHGADAVIAQGAEAGGHRGMFLSTDTSSQVGTMALVPRVVDAVDVPVVAAGGIGDARGVAAASMLGASAVQIGTAYLSTPEAILSDVHRSALSESEDDTVLTNVMSGRPARGIRTRLIDEVGPISAVAQVFPLASNAIQPLRSASEKAGSRDFAQMWSGQAASLCVNTDAEDLTRRLADEALKLLQR